MARIYSREGKAGAVWYLDYKQNGQRIRKRLGKSKDLAEKALADVQANRECKEIAKTVAAARVVTIQDRPMVILPLHEYETLLARAERQDKPSRGEAA